MPNICIERMFAPQQWPQLCFDLIVLSEMIYYLNAAHVAALADRVQRTLTHGGDVVLVHWRGETDYPLAGDEAAELFISYMKGFAQIAYQDRRYDFRIDILTAI